ncbi:MAG: SWIM zinc finger family protein [Calditrichia bacterium]
MSAALDYTYIYPYQSHVQTREHHPHLTLATCNGKQQNPYFFEGRLLNPRTIGNMFLVLSDVVRTHFFLPRPALLDPVLTSNDELIRLEGFSGCCGVYVRVDLFETAFESSIKNRGTTNVDFNVPMRNALMRLRDDEDVTFSIGEDEVVLSRKENKTIEKKVKLPLRWIKGFSEVQAYQAGLKPALEINALEALKFIRTLPKANISKRPTFVVPAGKSLRLSNRESRNAIRISGTHRIRILEPLLAQANSLRIWYDSSSLVSGWEVSFNEGRFFLVISPELYRGFTGEGQNLFALADSNWQAILPGIRSQLRWQNQINVDDLAKQMDEPKDAILSGLAVLGARGLAGYDVMMQKYFHRELPFDLEKIESMQPRLKNARKLLEEKAVLPGSSTENKTREFAVIGSNARYHVRLNVSGDECTCPWFSKYQGQRGPCKHILASQLYEDTSGSQEV